jgi:hypothetical protein
LPVRLAERQKLTRVSRARLGSSDVDRAGISWFYPAEAYRPEQCSGRLVSVVQSGNAWIVMCGGGDIYEMAGAIYKSAGDISRLKGTDLNVTGITNANPGVVTTDITHGFSSGQVIQHHRRNRDEWH